MFPNQIIRILIFPISNSLPRNSAGRAIVSPHPVSLFEIRSAITGKTMQQTTKQDTARDDEKTQENHGPPERMFNYIHLWKKKDFSSACSTKGDDLDIHFDSHFTHESWESSTRVTIEKEQNIKAGQRNSPPKSPKILYFHISTLLKTPPNPKLASRLHRVLPKTTGWILKSLL